MFYSAAQGFFKLKATSDEHHYAGMKLWVRPRLTSGRDSEAAFLSLKIYEWYWSLHVALCEEANVFGTFEFLFNKAQKSGNIC